MSAVLMVKISGAFVQKRDPALYFFVACVVGPVFAGSRSGSRKNLQVFFNMQSTIDESPTLGVVFDKRHRN